MNDEAKCDELDELLGGLPREIAPPRDLWPGISRRLTPRRVAVPRRRSWAEKLRLPVIESWHGWAWQGAVAAFGILLGVVLAGGPQAPVDRGVVAPLGGTAQPASFESASFEDEFLRVKNDLWAAAYARRSGLSEETLEVVENNLRLIDVAIRDLRLALDQDPGNQHLQDRIVDHHRKEIQILRRLALGAGNV